MPRHPSGLLIVLVCCVIGAEGSAFAQAAGTATGGVIWGTVTDESGAAMPGVTVTVEGRALMGSPATVTNVAGVYRFPSLPPGQYKLTFVIPGFSTVAREDIRISAGFTATVDEQMKVSTLEETIEVVGGSPVLDAVNTRLQTTFTADRINALPVTREIWSILAASPAIQMSRIDVGGSTAGTQTGYRSYGISSQNEIVVEGINSTEASGSTGLYFDFGSFDEVNIGSAAQPADMGNPGSRSVMISKSGGNTYHGDFYGDYETRAFQTTNIDAEQIAAGVEPGTNRIHSYYDVNVNGGGYVKRDTLWWFGSYRRQDIQNRFPNFPPKPQGTVIDAYTGKVTYQLPKNNKLVGYTMWAIKTQPYRFNSLLLGSTGIHVDPNSTWDQWAAGWIWKIEWNKTFGSNTFAEARVGSWGEDWTQGSHTDEPRREDITTRVITGGNYNFDSTQRRPQVTMALSYFKDDWLGSHNFKFGSTLQKDYRRLVWLDAYPGNVVHALRSSAAAEVYHLLAPIDSRNFLRWDSFYVTDTWNVGALSINAGVRFDRYRSGYPDQSRSDSRFGPGVQVQGVDNLVTWNELAPRVGVSWDVSRDSRNVLKASYGRYHHNPSRTVAEAVNPNNTPQWRRYTWVDTSGDLLWQPGEERGLLETRGGIAPQELAADLADPFTDEATLFFERQIASNLAVRTGFVYRGTEGPFTSRNVLNPFSAFNIPVTAADPGPDGLTGTGDDGVFNLFDLQPDLVGRTARVLQNAFDYDASYRTFEIAANRHFAGRWSLNASYAVTWRNDYESVPQNPNEPDLTDLLPMTFVKISGSVDPGAGLRFSPLLRFQSGEPFARSVNVRLNYGNQRVLAEPVGDRGHDNTLILDLRTERRFAVGGRFVSLFVDVYNIFNTNAAPTRNTATGSTFLRPLTIIPPRVFKVGAKASW
jgi:Carboxypeptidase regulatory-like domain